ncbi:SHOCT domain-containing protein [Vibrio sp. nBUS_14]
MGISIWQALIVLLIVIPPFIPIIIAHKKKHAYRVAITILSVVGLFIFLCWVAALIWCFIEPARKQYPISDELEKLYELKQKGVITDDEFIMKKKELL